MIVNWPKRSGSCAACGGARQVSRDEACRHGVEREGGAPQEKANTSRDHRRARPPYRQREADDGIERAAPRLSRPRAGYRARTHSRGHASCALGARRMITIGTSFATRCATGAQSTAPKLPLPAAAATSADRARPSRAASVLSPAPIREADPPSPLHFADSRMVPCDRFRRICRHASIDAAGPSASIRHQARRGLHFGR